MQFYSTSFQKSSANLGSITQNAYAEIARVTLVNYRQSVFRAHFG